VIAACIQFFRLQSTTKMIVIKNGVYRFFFDRLYVKHREVIDGTAAESDQLADALGDANPREIDEAKEDGGVAGGDK
jgi:hypothetical protein